MEEQKPPNLPQFATPEHFYIGNNTKIWMLKDGVWKEESGGTTLMTIGEGSDKNNLSLGSFVGLGGDYYACPNEPISEGVSETDREKRFLDARASLTVLPNQKELTEIIQLIEVEDDAVQEAVNHPQIGVQPSSVYQQWGLSHEERFNYYSGGKDTLDWFLPWNWGRYMHISYTNVDHFGQDARIAYSVGHKLALQKASEGHQSQNPDILRDAYIMDGFACHFLTDSFSAGHMRTPRSQLHDAAATDPYSSDACALMMHNEECLYGLHVQTSPNVPAPYQRTWTAFGDERLFDDCDKDNLNQVMKSAKASVDEIYEAFRYGKVPSDASQYTALWYCPDLDILGEDADGPRKCNSPLFRMQDGGVVIRKSIDNLQDYEWTSDFAYLEAVAKIELSTPIQQPPGEGTKATMTDSCLWYTIVVNYWKNLQAPFSFSSADKQWKFTMDEQGNAETFFHDQSKWKKKADGPGPYKFSFDIERGQLFAIDGNGKIWIESSMGGQITSPPFWIDFGEEDGLVVRSGPSKYRHQSNK
eukprot:TRINITY_DN10648_c0_g1_i1.p1 TRINITY_DN10648_c0_g1~~TRINITY_DN10648_c0_g1_i1.p1  ORF type:complete len:547 (-),score=142.63 TRINITY_DN10648_c0_g1_i1:75-1661(-)